jgi:hypothetical protein
MKPVISLLLGLVLLIVSQLSAWAALAAPQGFQLGNPATPPIPTTTSISQYGITWTFANPVRYGQFVNGDYWVVDSGNGVSISSISPAFTTSPRAMNGAMVDPVTGWSSPQGYDDNHGSYSATVNVAINMPLVLHGNQSLVSVASNAIPQNNGKQYINTTAILTSVTSAPASGSLRPGISGTTKTIHNISEIDYSKLAKLPIPSGQSITIANYTTILQPPFLLHSDAETNDYLHSSAAGNLPYYYYPPVFAEAALILNLDYDNSIKQPLLINYIQQAIDMYSYYEAGGRVYPDGGENLGRKLPILFAGTVLNYAPMVNMMAKTGTYIYSNGHGPYTTKPSDYVSFPEDGKVFYVTQDDVNITSGTMYDNNVSCPGNTYWCPDARNHTPAPYTSAMIGMPELGIRYSTRPNYSDSSWLAMYRQIGTAEPTWVGESMVVRIMGLKTTWNNPAYFDYVDRYVGLRRGTYTAYTVPSQPSAVSPTIGGYTSLINAMWDTYRKAY